MYMSFEILLTKDKKSVLTERCNFMQYPAIVVICRLSVTRVYCDKMAEVIGLHSFNKNVAQCISSLSAVFYDKIRRCFDLGLKVGWGNFGLRDAISRKQCEIEPRWQLITTGLSIATKVDDLKWPWTSIHCSVIVESIEMHVHMTSKYGSRVLLATYAAILLIRIARLIIIIIIIRFVKRQNVKRLPWR